MIYYRCLRTTRRNPMMVYEVRMKNTVDGRTKVLRVNAETCMDANREALLDMGSFGMWTVVDSKLVSVRY